MTIQIQAPDGSIAQFPDGTSDATIKSVMAKSYGAPTPDQARAQAYAKDKMQGAGPVLSFMNGRSFNFAPEFMGGAAWFDTAMNNLEHTLKGEAKPFGASDAYQATVDASRQEASNYAKAHPVANFGLGVTGAVANPVNKMAGDYVAAAPSIGQAMLRGGATGGLIGATYGAGQGGPGNRLGGAAAGGLSGAATGALVPPVAAGIGAVGRKIVGTGKDILAGARNVMNPPPEDLPVTPSDTDAALGQLSTMIKARGWTPANLSGADEFGKGVTTAEAMGRPGVMSLGALGRRSGQTPDALEAMLADRAANAPSRILNDFADAAGIHPEEAAGNIEAMTTRLKAQAKPLFDAALSSPEPVWNTDLAKLAQRPVVKKAIDAAGNDLLNAGKDPQAMGFAIDPDTGNFVLGNDLSKTMEAYPTAETWDLVRQRIGDQVERHPITGKILPDSVSRGNYNIGAAQRDLTMALAGDPANGVPGAIPGYRAALDKSGEYLQLQSAYDRAQKTFLNPNVSATTFAKTFNGLSEPEQQAWKAGIASNLSDQLQKGRLTPRQLMLPHVQGKLSATLGPDAAAQLLSRLQVEAKLAATGGRMMPGAGSPSMEYINAAGEQEGGPNVLSMIAHAAKNPGKAIIDLAQAGKTIGTTPQTRDELGRLLMQPPDATMAELQNMRIPQTVPGGIPKLPYGAASGMIGSVSANRRRAK